MLQMILIAIDSAYTYTNTKPQLKQRIREIEKHTTQRAAMEKGDRSEEEDEWIRTDDAAS